MIKHLKKFTEMLGIGVRDGAHAAEGAGAGAAPEAAVVGGGGGGEDDGRVAAGSRRRTNRGFSVQVPVAVEWNQLGPVLVPCEIGNGGVQGLNWYRKTLTIDEDGDVADDFLDEVPSLGSELECQDRRNLPLFRVKEHTRPAPVTDQFVDDDGNVRYTVRYKGTLKLV